MHPDSQAYRDAVARVYKALALISQWWEPLFGHGAEPQQRARSTTHWVMLRRRNLDAPRAQNQPQKAGVWNMRQTRSARREER